MEPQLSSRLKVALLFQDGNFVGREYLHCLDQAGRSPDLICAVGRMKDDSIAREVARTGGGWTPPPVSDHRLHGRFSGTTDPALWALLRDHTIDVAIQGGIGILKPDMIAVPRLGFVNVHPGKLPEYRGNSCPEWALWENQDIWATAHMIDEGIDTGPVICAEAMTLESLWDYCAIRANIYPHCAKVLIKALAILDNAPRMGGIDRVISPQIEQGARYLPPMPEDTLSTLKARFNRRAVMERET